MDEQDELSLVEKIQDVKDKLRLIGQKRLWEIATNSRMRRTRNNMNKISPKYNKYNEMKFKMIKKKKRRNQLKKMRKEHFNEKNNDEGIDNHEDKKDINKIKQEIKFQLENEEEEEEINNSHVNKKLKKKIKLISDSDQESDDTDSEFDFDEFREFYKAQENLYNFTKKSNKRAKKPTFFDSSDSYSDTDVLDDISEFLHENNSLIENHKKIIDEFLLSPPTNNKETNTENHYNSIETQTNKKFMNQNDSFAEYASSEKSSTRKVQRKKVKPKANQFLSNDMLKEYRKILGEEEEEEEEALTENNKNNKSDKNSEINQKKESENQKSTKDQNENIDNLEYSVNDYKTSDNIDVDSDLFEKPDNDKASQSKFITKNHSNLENSRITVNNITSSQATLYSTVSSGTEQMEMIANQPYSIIVNLENDNFEDNVNKQLKGNKKKNIADYMETSDNIRVSSELAQKTEVSANVTKEEQEEEEAPKEVLN